MVRGRHCPDRWRVRLPSRHGLEQQRNGMRVKLVLGPDDDPPHRRDRLGRPLNILLLHLRLPHL